MTALKRILPGYYEGEGIKVEKTAKGWRTGVSCRQIGRTLFYEYSLKGLIMDVGTFKTLAVAQHVRDVLSQGTHIVQIGHSTDAGRVPAMVLPWETVKDEIAAHPSVTGQ